LLDLKTVPPALYKTLYQYYSSTLHNGVLLNNKIFLNGIKEIPKLVMLELLNQWKIINKLKASDLIAKSEQQKDRELIQKIESKLDQAYIDLMIKDIIE
jgi:hypothetical protein